MNEYNFEVFFVLNNGEDPESHLDALFEAGCDDATVGIGTPGYIGLEFSRESTSAKKAIASAIKNIKKAIQHAQLDHAAPYLVNLSELAFLFGCSKQNMRKYARDEMASIDSHFPSPVVSGKTSYWLIAEVALWLKQHSTLEIDDETVEMYLAIWSLNQANENLNQPNPEMTKEFYEILKSVA